MANPNRLYRERVGVNISSDGSTVTFDQSSRYVFDAEASAPLTESDPIIVLNMHLNVSNYRPIYKVSKDYH